MTWESFYFVCFLVGFLLSLVAFAGQILDIQLPGAVDHAGGGLHLHLGDGTSDFHAGAHVDAGNADAGADGHAGHEASKLNFSTITPFLAWFGGTGYLLNRYTPVWIWLVFALASLSGLAGASVVFWLLSRLMKRDRTLDPADYDMIGVLGRVSSPVRSDGVGEMIFIQDGARRSVPIRSEDGNPISRETEVVVTRYQRGIAYVRRWDELTGDAEDSAPKTAGL